MVVWLVQYQQLRYRLTRQHPGQSNLQALAATKPRARQQRLLGPDSKMSQTGAQQPFGADKALPLQMGQSGFLCSHAHQMLVEPCHWNVHPTFASERRQMPGKHRQQARLTATIRTYYGNPTRAEQFEIRQKRRAERQTQITPGQNPTSLRQTLGLPMQDHFILLDHRGGSFAHLFIKLLAAHLQTLFSTPGSAFATSFLPAEQDLRLVAVFALATTTGTALLLAFPLLAQFPLAAFTLDTSTIQRLPRSLALLLAAGLVEGKATTVAAQTGR